MLENIETGFCPKDVYTSLEERCITEVVLPHQVLRTDQNVPASYVELKDHQHEDLIYQVVDIGKLLSPSPVVKCRDGAFETRYGMGCNSAGL